MDYEKYGTVGKEIYNFTFIGLSKLYIQTTKAEWIEILLPTNEEKHTLEMKKFLKQAYPGLTLEEIDAKKGTEWHAYSDGTERAKEVEAAYNNYVKAVKAKETKKNITAAGLALGMTLGLSACGTNNSITLPANETTAQVAEATTEADEVNYDEGVDLTGKTPEQVLEMLQNGEINKTQADFFLNIYNWINENSLKEDWQSKTFTEDELKEINELLTSMGYNELEDNEVIFNYTPEEVMALSLMYGHDSQDELVSISGGEKYDVDRLRELSNEAMRKIIISYIYSDGVDIEGLNIFNDKELAAIKEADAYWKEYKELLASENYKDAEAKMVEFRNWVVDFAHNTDSELDNVKGYILSTEVMAAQVYSSALGYKETATFHVEYNGNATEISVKNVPLFPETTMNELVLGWDNWDVDEFKRQYGIDIKYALTGFSDVSTSYVDSVCDVQDRRIENANEKIEELRQNDLLAESANAAVKEFDLTNLEVMDNIVTRYDELTDKTVSRFDLCFALDAKLEKDGKAEKNVVYFQTVGLSEIIRNVYVRVNPSMGPTGGIDPNTIGIVLPPQEITAQQAVDQFGVIATDAAEEAAAAAVGAFDANTPEEQQYVADTVQQQTQATLQQIYNATFNYYAGEAYFSGTIAFNPAWENDADPLVRQEFAWAKADGLKYKEDKAKVGQTTGGETTYYQETTTTGTDLGYGPQPDQKPDPVTTIDNGPSVVPEGLQTAGDIDNFIITDPSINDSTYVSDDPNDPELQALLHN